MLEELPKWKSALIGQTRTETMVNQLETAKGNSDAISFVREYLLGFTTEPPKNLSEEEILRVIEQITR